MPVRLLRHLAACAVALVALPAPASFHLWAIDEIYSNADGTVQFVEMSAFAGGQQFLAGHTLASNAPGGNKLFTFPSNLPGDTLGKKMLLGTAGFAALGVVAPDYVLPDGFLSRSGGTLVFADIYDVVNHGALPSDGVLSIDRTGATATNSPTNFFGTTGTVPPPLVNLTVGKAGAGSGTVVSSPAGIACGAACTAGFSAGTLVTLTATPAAGSGFAGWAGGGCAGTGPCALTLAAATSVTASFETGTAIPRLGNISTRMQVLTGDDVMIGGFIIGGTVPKTVVVRASGPSLVPFGIANALANPVLQLFTGPTPVATNDNWQEAANAATLQASGFAPGNALESAIHMTLAPGAYTGVVTGAGGATGVGIIEVFEVDQPGVPLANISTRGRVLTGNDVMIGGFVINGTSPQTVVVRARGPSLIPFGIASALADPELTLVRSSDQGVLATNDDWGSAANAAQVTASGFAPANAKESAILVTLPPGAYTAIVRGVANTTGVAIIEVFAQ